MLSLTIISHTPHYYGNNGAIVGLEPTVREINYLSQLFETSEIIIKIQET